MSENPRDEQFQGFAQLLWPEIKEELEHYLDIPYFETHEDFIRPRIEQTIAQRAYDLVAHTIDSIDLHYAVYQPREEYKPEDIPDMTAWPKEVQ